MSRLALDRVRCRSVLSMDNGASALRFDFGRSTRGDRGVNMLVPLGAVMLSACFLAVWSLQPTVLRRRRVLRERSAVDRVCDSVCSAVLVLCVVGSVVAMVALAV